MFLKKRAFSLFERQQWKFLRADCGWSRTVQQGCVPPRTTLPLFPTSETLGTTSCASAPCACASWATSCACASCTTFLCVCERPCHSSLLRRHWAQHLVQVHLVLVHHGQHLLLVHLVQHSCASANDLATLLFFGDIEHNVLAHVHQLYALSVVMIHGLCMYYEQCVLKYVLCSVSMCCVPDWQNRL